MKKLILFAAGLFAGAPLVFAEPTESRTWTATNGKKVEGKVISIQGGKATLERADGKKVEVAMAIFVDEDRKFLEEHFEIEAPKPGEPAKSGAAPAEDLPHAQGEVVGPLDAGDGATYYLYLPKSLKEGRLAPLLFYTDAGGGNPGLIKGLTEGAELCGWVMAASVQSKNGQDLAINVKVSKAAVDHIVKTLPVDPERVYFTGNSGGGATAMANSAAMNAAGAMPNIGYIPDGVSPPKGHYFAIGGGKDYNRYHTAQIGKKFGKDGVHRMNPGGHGGAPPWQRIDGMIWLNLRYLAAERKKLADEAADFEADLITWMRDKAGSESHRAYSTARLMKDDYEVKGANLALVDGLIDELGKEEKNRLYHEGLEVIDGISEDAFAGEAGASLFAHTCKKATSQAEKALERFAGVPVIEDTLKAIAAPTVGQ